MKRLSSLFLVIMAIACGATARERINFDKGWLFALADSVQMSALDYNDSKWHTLNVPHDWAI